MSKLHVLFIQVGFVLLLLLHPCAVKDPSLVLLCTSVCVCVQCVSLIVVPKPAAGTPPWTPAALVWIAPPPICNTEHRGGSLTAGLSPPGATKQVNGHIVGIILPSQITRRPWQWGFAPTSPPCSWYFASFPPCTVAFIAPLLPR